MTWYLNITTLLIKLGQFGDDDLSQNQPHSELILTLKEQVDETKHLLLPDDFKLCGVLETFGFSSVIFRIVRLPLLAGQLLHVVPLPANLNNEIFSSLVLTDVAWGISEISERRYKASQYNITAL